MSAVISHIPNRGPSCNMLTILRAAAADRVVTDRLVAGPQGRDAVELITDAGGNHV